MRSSPVRLRKFLGNIWVWRLVGLGFSALFLFFAFYYQYRGSLLFYTDLGRDFLLLQDLVVKKVTFIGARTSLQGVFHGPLWLYLNLLAFALTHGNPLSMGWYWMGLTLLFVLSVYFVTRRLFDERAAIVSTVLTSANMIVFAHFFTNPIGALFVMPWFIFFIVRYWQTGKARFLIAHLLAAGAVIQFEMMLGVPLLGLTVGLAGLRIWKHQTWKHLLAFTVLAIPFSTWAIFEVRHQFLELRSLLDYVTGRIDQFPSHKEFATILGQKVELITHGNLGVFPWGKFEALNGLTLIGFVSVFAREKARAIKNIAIYAIFLFYFLGYFLLSFVLKDTLLTHYFYPLVVLPIMAFASLHQRMNKWLFCGTLALVLIAGVIMSNDNAYFVRNDQHTSENDWQTLMTMAGVPYSQGESSFGYFVYAPDIYAYQQKYAVSYIASQHPDADVHPFSKQRVTYIFIAAPSRSKLEMNSADWMRLKLHLDPKIKAKAVWSLPGDYTVLKYILTDEQVKVPVDPDIGNSTFFR